MLKWLLILSYALVVNASALWASPCENLFESLGVNSLGRIVASTGTERRVPVTGPDRYPLTAVLSDLQITEAFKSRLAGKRIISLGEGYSELLPWLLKLSPWARGIDLWYDLKIPIPKQGEQAQLMLDYRQKYQPFLLTASATDLPFPSESVDFVLSHQLVNNLNPADIRKVLTEAIRVLAIGGEARLYGFSMQSHSKVLNDVLSPLFAEGIIVPSFEEVPLILESNSSPREEHRFYLLKIKKINKQEKPAPIPAHLFE